ncbi:MAG: DNA-binding protein WhiA [Candidatus Limnocylindrales bacterium]
MTSVTARRHAAGCESRRRVDQGARRVDEGARQLVEALRAELAAVEPGRACCRAAERDGLGSAATGQARDAVVARLAVRLEHADRGMARFEWSTAAEHCRLAWLRGRFLARGSLSLASGRTHLEFVLPATDGDAFAVQLAELGLPARLRSRRGAAVVTWKSAATVTRFLRLAGASATVLELESLTVARELRSDLNRQLNAETANIRRGIATAARQVAAIEQLEASGRLDSLPATTRAVARARLATPEASISELAAELDSGRSAIQRALERLEAEAARMR